MRLYLNQRPRTFILTSNGYALVIRHPNPTYKEDGNGGKKVEEVPAVIVEFCNTEILNLANYKEIVPSRRNGQMLGFLGFLLIKNNILLGFITGDETIASPTLHDTVHRITGVEFFCVQLDAFDQFVTFQEYNNNNGRHIGRPNAPDEYLDQGESLAHSVKKLISLGDFFYSPSFDITLTMQERGYQANPLFKLRADGPYCKRFMWNRYMTLELIDFRKKLPPIEQEMFDTGGFITPISRGYAQTLNSVINNEDALITMISKQACLKSGHLFGEWGIDDQGEVANYMETEIIIYTHKFCFAYVVVRGNVPIFYETETHFSKRNILIAVSKSSKKMRFPRSFETSQLALGRHFDGLAYNFGDIAVVNGLTSDESSYKSQLSKKYKEHLEKFIALKNDAGNYRLFEIDLHVSKAFVKKVGFTSVNPHNIISIINDRVVDFGAYFYGISDNTFTGRQLGVFRVNSFDNLHKASFISKVICQRVIELAIEDMGITLESNTEIIAHHAKLWEENDYQITRLTTSYITNFGKLAVHAVNNTVKSHFSAKYLSGVVPDNKGNDTAMLKMLGRKSDQVSVTLFSPILDLLQEIDRRNTAAKVDDANTESVLPTQQIKLFAGTFNVSGKCPTTSITEWIYPTNTEGEVSYDIVFIGIQEVVELTTGQIPSRDVGKARFWENKIKSTLDENPLGIKYVSLWVGMLGTTALFLFVKESQVDKIRGVEGNVKKTGLGGMAANKGGVAVSFCFNDTLICLVSCHLAAGLSNIDERHQNYKTLVKGFRFLKNRSAKDHDAVIWLGDFNYRIGLPNEQVKPLIERKQYSRLFEFDQLHMQMANGITFPFYDEMEITFPPTYKFDLDSDIYDTSEKQRIPAWTDRILSLSKGKVLTPKVYNSCPTVKFSDHRPVYGIFEVSVHSLSASNNKSNLALDRVSGIDLNTTIFKKDDLSYLVFNDNDKALPPPSTDSRKWWLDGNKSVKMSIKELNDNDNELVHDPLVVNPFLPINPFEQTDKPEFIKKSTLLEMIR
ncbi:inositol-1 [Scheffersomyces spartinae]|uniref:phosphoinositide 5-phosphatase n=1 Tax=Scheffersomyces spartinae TaxID=45513 RepID=A0A9P7V964_9ASCO|nr:inositol-1 [Scheffersomyces spartinae]KAG7193596.1 inositol-1 [Scheffersomyces spartinae]